MRILEVITERKSADLYHSTHSDETFLSILKSGFIKPNFDSEHITEKDPRPYISLSRDKRFDMFGSLPITFVIDQNKLTSSHKITPYDSFAGDDDYLQKSSGNSEAEERVYKPIPISYIKYVIIRDPDWIDVETVIDAAKKYKLPVVDLKGNRLDENLTERKSADLYHNTMYPVEILKSGKIKAFLDTRHDHEAGPGAKPFISLTRDPRFDFFGMGDAQFVIDQGKLANTHKIVPFDYGGYSDDEAYGRRQESEERVFKDIPLSYVKKIVVQTQYNVAAKDYIPLAKELGIPVVDRKGNRLDENFADGKNPGRKGLSQRVGIPKNATIAQLEKAAKAGGEKGRMARWQLNMRRGRKKGK